MLKKTDIPKFIPELDGLRAISILSVLFFHLNVPGFSLGWSGVFLFFVISGFLITGILLDAKGQEHYYKNFFIRRSLRIFPIYYISLIAIYVLSCLLNKPNSDFFWYLIYGQNYLLGFTGFAAAFPASFSHTWSLAIEEQFYFLWPFLVCILTIRKLVILLLVFVVVAISSRVGVWVYTNNPFLVFTTLPSTIDSLAIGAMLAIVIRLPLSRKLIVNSSIVICSISLLSLIMIISCYGFSCYWSPVTMISSKPMNLFIYTIMALFFCSLMSLVIHTDTVFSRLLRIDIFKQIGKISYGLYLYHLPVYMYVNILAKNMTIWGGEIDTIVIGMVKLIITYIISLLSWHLVETKFIKAKDKFSYNNSTMVSAKP